MAENIDKNRGRIKGHDTARRRDTLIGYVAQIAAVCIVMMWSVMNIVHNFWAFVGMNQNPVKQAPQANWTVAVLMAVLLGVVPFCLSLYWLFCVVRKSKL